MPWFLEPWSQVHWDNISESQCDHKHKDCYHRANRAGFHIPSLSSMCVTAFVAEDTQVRKIQTFPTIPKVHSCENIFLYETHQLIIFRKKLCNYLLLFSHSVLKFLQKQERTPQGTRKKWAIVGRSLVSKTRGEELGLLKRSKQKQYISNNDTHTLPMWYTNRVTQPFSIGVP